MPKTHIHVFGHAERSFNTWSENVSKPHLKTQAWTGLCIRKDTSMHIICIYLLYTCKYSLSLYIYILGVNTYKCIVCIYLYVCVYLCTLQVYIIRKSWICGAIDGPRLVQSLAVHKKTPFAGLVLLLISSTKRTLQDFFVSTKATKQLQMIPHCGPTNT